ncbi:hypothetical protein ACOSQ3_016234 [Xanthoceras sorbifolium]
MKSENWDSEYRDLVTATTGRDELLAMTKIENPGSEHRDHHRDQDTAMCDRDEDGGIAPVSNTTWWRDHRSRRRSR